MQVRTNRTCTISIVWSQKRIERRGKEAETAEANREKLKQQATEAEKLSQQAAEAKRLRQRTYKGKEAKAASSRQQRQRS